MANNVPVTPSASYTVAAEDVGGGVEVQQVKLLGGAAADTTGIGAGGTIVVSVTGPVQVSGAVSISVMPAVSGTVTVNGSVAVVPGVSVVAQVSGTVTIGPTTFTVNTAVALAGSTTGSSGMSGVLVWLGASQTVLISTQVSGTVTVNGSVAVVPGVSVVAQVSGTVTIAPTTLTVNTAGTIAGASVTIQQGASVSAVVSGTVSILNVVPVVTAASASVTGIPVWLNPTQPVVVNTIAAGFSVNALVTGVVSVSVLPAVSISVSAVLGTIITQLGTQVVTVVPGLSVSAVVSGTVTVANASVLSPTTAGPSVSATGIVVWIGGGQSSTAVPVVITGTVTAGAGTTVVSGTITAIPIDRTAATPDPGATGQIVWVANPGGAVATTIITVNTIAAGFSVNALVTGVVSVSVMPAVSISVSAVLGTIVTILGTQIVSVVPGLSVSGVVSGTVSVLNVVPVVTQASASVTGVPVWFTAGALVAVSGIAPATTQASVSVSGVPVWWSPTAMVANSGLLFTVGLPVQASTAQIMVVKPAPMQPVLIIVAATAVAVSANKYIFTIWTGLTGAPAAAGTTSWAVPAGKVLQLDNIQIAMTSSAVLGGSIQAFVGVGATASMVSASISTQLQLMKIQVFGAAALVSAALNMVSAHVLAGESIAVWIAASTAAISRDLVITGQLF